VRAVLCVLAAAVLVAGCGGGDEPDRTAGPTATPPPPATPSPSVTATPTGSVQPLPSVSPEDQPGGAGDENEAARVPVEFTVTDGKITPPQVAVPAFLALELIVHNKGSQPAVVRLEGAEPLTVAPGQTRHARLEGRKKGSYVVDAGSAGQAVLVTGAQPGP
jgi:hypothetical protein